MHFRTEEEVQAFLKRPSHALVLSGPKSSGKGYLANYLASELLKGQNLHANCRFYEADQIGIDEVRSIIGFLKFTALGNDTKRVIVIEHLEELKHEAQNALLKVLEEPPENTIFITTSSEIGSVLRTVISRMRVLNVSPLTLEQATKIFTNHTEEEIKKAYYISDGAVALMTGILESDQHDLAEAIKWAKNVLRLSQYDRMILVEDLAKNQSKLLPYYTLALQKVLRASLLYGKELTGLEAKHRVRQLEEILKAREDLKVKVSPKLVLTNLFLKL